MGVVWRSEWNYVNEDGQSRVKEVDMALVEGMEKGGIILPVPS